MFINKRGAGDIILEKLLIFIYCFLLKYMHKENESWKHFLDILDEMSSICYVWTQIIGY